MYRLTATVEAMTRQMAQIVDSTWSVLWSKDRLSASLETFLKECHFFTAPWDKDEKSEDSEVEADPEEVKQEVQGLHEEQENCQDRFFTNLISTRGLGVRGWPSGKTKMLRSVVALPE